MVKRKAPFGSSNSSGAESEESDWDAEIYDLPKKPPSKPKLNKSLTGFSEHSTSENEFRHASSDSSHEEFNDGYMSDFMGDAEDRANLARMTEKEREQEIFKRIENRDVLKTRFGIEKKLRQAQRREMKKLRSIQDKKVERYFNDKERDRRAEENRDKKLKSSSSSRKRHDSQRSTHRSDNQVRHSKTKLKASEVYSDDSGSSSEDERVSKSKQKSKSKSKQKKFSSSDSSSDSDVKSKSRAHSTKAPAISTPSQLNQIRLSRCKLEQFLLVPFFKRVVTGCFVRLIVGTSSNKPIYKICEIIDVNEDASYYQLGSMKTNKILRLKYGPHERDIRIQFISNQEFNNDEFEKWQKVCSVQGTLLPKVDHVQTKLRDIKEAILYHLKEDDIERIMRRKERFRTNPHNYAVKKNQLLKDREIAQSLGDIAKADDIQDELADLEKRTLDTEKLRTTTVSNINYINNRNRKKYNEEAEKIAAEMKLNKDQKVDDPFTRRHTKPTMVFRKKDPSREDLLEGTSSFSEPKNDKHNDSFNFARKINPQKQGEEMYSAHNFDIKIEFNDDTPAAPVTAPSTDDKVAKENSSKRSLNLEDYKKRKGFL